MQTEDWKRELAEVFFVRIRIIRATALAIFAGAVLVALFWPSTYAASGSVLVRGVPVRVSPEAMQTPELKNLDVSREDIATEVAIVTSPDLIRRIVDPAGTRGEDPAVRAAAQRIHDGLSTEIVATSHVIVVSLADRDADWAKKTLEALLREYLSFRSQVFHPSGQEDFLRQRADKYKADLAAIEDKLVQMSKDSSVTLPEREMGNNADLIRDLKGKLSELQVEHVQLEREMVPLTSALAQDTPQYFAFLNMAAIDRLADKLKELRAEFSRLERSFEPGSDRLLAVEQDMKKAYDDLRSEARKVLETRTVTLESVKARRTEVEQTITSLEKRNVLLHGHATEITRLNREAGLLAFSYETFSRRAEEARINSAIANASFSGEVSILSWPATPVLVFPRVGMTLILGLLVGIVAGCTLGFLVEFLDHTIKRPNDVKRFASLPTIFSLRQPRPSAQ